MKIVFLDRDGTLVKEPSDERVDAIKKIELFPDSIAALKYMADHDFAAVIITNQAGVAEGKITEEEFWTIHKEILKQLAPSGISFLKTYMNGEAGANASEWRKPGSKMLLQAVQDLHLKVNDIFMIGNSQSDIQAAVTAGCKGAILVNNASNYEGPKPVYVASNLLDAARYVVAHS